MILCETGAIHTPTSNFVHLNTVPQHWPWAELTRQQSLIVLAGQCLLVRRSSLATFVEVPLGPPNKLGWGDLDFFQVLDQIPDQKESEISVCIFCPTLTESNCWVLSDPEGGETIFWYTWRYVDLPNKLLAIRSELLTYAMWQFIPFHDVRLHRWLLSQKFPSHGGGFMLVSMYTSRLSLQANANFPLFLPIRLRFSV
jgi:hypothetical protein